MFAEGSDPLSSSLGNGVESADKYLRYRRCARSTHGGFRVNKSSRSKRKKLGRRKGKRRGEIEGIGRGAGGWDG